MILVAPVTSRFSTHAPLIIIDPASDNELIPSVSADNRTGAVAVMTHLIELGHRRIGFISGRQTLLSAKQREAGYLHALAQADIETDLGYSRKTADI